MWSQLKTVSVKNELSTHLFSPSSGNISALKGLEIATNNWVEVSKREKRFLPGDDGGGSVIL